MIEWTDVREALPEPVKEGELFLYMGRQFRARLLFIIGTRKLPLINDAQDQTPYRECNPNIYGGFYDHRAQKFFTSNGDELTDVTKWSEINT